MEVRKYVDDGVQIEIINMETATMNSLGTRKTKHAVPSQNVFRHVVRKATARGMKVNSDKTALLCISDSLATTSAAYINDSDGNKLSTGDGLKMLGFHFDSRPTVSRHLEVLKRRFRQRTWVINHLKHAGFNSDELAKVYRTMVRPVADYMSVVYHSMMTAKQDEEVERLQSQALKLIYGRDVSYRVMRARAGVETLRQRRIDAVDKFASKCTTGRFSHWFPLKGGRRSGRGVVREEKYLESFARCDRLKNSPLYYMRRRLNGKPGKSYGSRNSNYRPEV